ncbi:MAG TPA: MBOAT family O-acyltransferase [Syntrophorhabdaceae bacterium]|nr:MBOAT family O-acyltransferase [Syntrophorhabdaceae bacterium]
MINIDNAKIHDLLYYSAELPMTLTSGHFIFFFALFLCVYIFAARNRFSRVLFLSLCSLFFVYRASGMCLFVLLASVMFNYLMAYVVCRPDTGRTRLAALVFGLSVNFASLAYFKYADFFIDTLSAVTPFSFSELDMAVPIGISFYTFTAAGYLIDVYRKETVPVRSVLDLVFFFSFFPKFLAGPIARVKELLPQAGKTVPIDSEAMNSAVTFIVMGIFKKLVIADTLGTYCVDRVFDSPLMFSGIENLLAVYCYMLQIYCDFSGYTDIAIGVALMMGFQLPGNFDLPYHALNISEFWRRWHMSLSRWFRDYLYIPLGGNRCGIWRQCFNVIATMLLCGLWHGPSWTFVFWGLLHGAALAVHGSFKRIVPRFGLSGRAAVPCRMACWFVTFNFVAFCWIFFRASSVEEAFNVIRQVVSSFDIALLPSLVSGYKSVIALLLVGYGLYFLPGSVDAMGRRIIARTPLAVQSLMLAAVIWLAIQVRSGEAQSFIYLRF